MLYGVCRKFIVGDIRNKPSGVTGDHLSRVAVSHASTQLSLLVPYRPSYHQVVGLTGGWFDRQPQPAANKERPMC